ncbi:hypothetical protein RHGRI_001322 [Rhododendron griersonianum]|uniref:Uncharacterized protein n=1 Tax=Rhododendron griersonianum TaxID=479676 RepID=A0AAV6LKN5_9ERIC|nr:hypothetical protein RHGRI_001322 [Rhododendron griersonianum]
MEQLLNLGNLICKFPEDWSIDLLKVKSFEIPISDSSSDEEDDADGDNNEEEDSQTDKLNGNDDNMEENKGKESNGILEDEATSAILGTTIHQHNQHGDNTIKEGGGVGQKQLPLTQEDGKSMEEKTKSPVQLDKDVSRVVDSMGLGAYHDDGPVTNEAISNLAQQIKKADGLALNSVGQIILDPKLVQVEIRENEGHLNNVDLVIDGGGEQRSLIQSSEPTIPLDEQRASHIQGGHLGMEKVYGLVLAGRKYNKKVN